MKKSYFLSLFSAILACALVACGYGGPPPVVVAAAPACFPIVVEGNVDMPPMADVAAAAVKDVQDAGLFVDGMTNDQAMALASAPLPNVNNFGGGGAYGGRYLTGSYRFEIDANGQRIDEKSWLKLFSDEKFPVTGGVTPDCTIAMGSIGGVDIRGKIADGKSTGKVMHGDGKTWIYGAMNGIATLVK